MNGMARRSKNAGRSSDGIGEGAEDGPVYTRLRSKGERWADQAETVVETVDRERDNVVIAYGNGDEYKGETLDGLPHGQGALQWASGDSYTGEFQRGLIKGQGRISMIRDGVTMVCDGNFENNQLSGQGTCRYSPSTET